MHICELHSIKCDSFSTLFLPQNTATASTLDFSDQLHNKFTLKIVLRREAFLVTICLLTF